MIKEPLETVTGAGHRLGEYIRDQRRGSQISLRQLATLAGVSNPYLSQIERGLRKPSAEILQQIAKGLRISAEALYLQAGILEKREGDGLVADAVLADEGLSERQKQVLLEIYDSFRRENGTPPEHDLPAPPVQDLPEQAPEPGSAPDGSAPDGSAPPARRRRQAARTTPDQTPGTTPTAPQEATA